MKSLSLSIYEESYLGRSSSYRVNLKKIRMNIQLVAIPIAIFALVFLLANFDQILFRIATIAIPFIYVLFCVLKLYQSKNDKQKTQWLTSLITFFITMAVVPIINFF